MEKIVYSHEGLDVIFYIENKNLRLYGIFPENVSARLQKNKFPHSFVWHYVETELLCTGENQRGHYYKIEGGEPGNRLQFNGAVEAVEKGNKKVVLKYTDAPLRLEVESHYLFIKGVPVIRRWVTVRNNSTENVGIEHLVSAIINGVSLCGTRYEWGERLKLHLPHSSWASEGQWRTGRLSEFGLQPAQGLWASSNSISVSQMGVSSSAYLPMAVLEDEKEGIVWFWQIEHNGSWHWEIGELNAGHAYVSAGGPNELKNHWWKNLKPGESFQTVPVAIGVSSGGFNEAVGHLTDYRRKACIRKHEDNEKLPVIFNDYMNCLKCDTRTETELPLIEAASRAGCEYFVIDAGWFCSRNETYEAPVGIWEESKDRYTGGLNKLFDEVRKKGMIPGLWLEVESFTSDPAIVKDKPESWFISRHGKKVLANGRHLLDFRNPGVREYISESVDRLIKNYGIGYIKNDYNAALKMGMDTNADSFGDGLLEHNRAFLSWLEETGKKYPGLVIENCGGGGMRMDYAMLSRCQLQSCSDQAQYFANPSIYSGSMAAVAPEQLAGWAYPLKDGDAEEVIFNMVNVMLGRIHLSGQLADISGERFKYVQEAISTYKTYRKEIPLMVPYYPTGTVIASKQDTWHSFALVHEKENTALLAVWRLKSKENRFEIPLSFTGRKNARVEQLYPSGLPAAIRHDRKKHSLSVCLKRKMTARLFKINY